MSVEEKSSTTAPDAQRSESILEDASTLLMFHNAAITSNKSPSEESKEGPKVETNEGLKVESKEQSNQQESQIPKESPPLTSAKSTTKSEESRTNSATSSTKLTPIIAHAQLPVNMSSPGPGVAALVESDQEGDDHQKKKAIVAAAALAAAQNLPMPFVGKFQRESLDDDKTDPIEPEDPIHEAVTVKAAKKEDEEDKDNETDVQADVETQDENADADSTITEPNGRAKSRKPRKPKQGNVPKDYIVDPDSGVISCVCGFEEDDGFTIQCDNCNRWQHAVCMGIDSMDNVPDDYSCNVCQPRKVDVKRAKAFQAQRLDALKRKKSRNSVNSDSGSELPSNNKPIDSKEERSNSRTQTAPKPKPKTPTNPYGKNLEEGDILVPDAKSSYLTSFYPLKDYDYQDNQVYKFIQELQTSSNPNFLNLSQQEYDELELPTIKVKPYSETANKKFNGISKLGLFTETAIQPSQIISEYLGEINFKIRYITDSRNHYRIWGVEKPYVSFVPNTPLVIDARNSGNNSRFIRRSCNPNCEILTLKLDNGTLKFVIVAKKPIKANTELSLSWNWDPNHSIHGIINGNTFDQTNDVDKPSLILSVESILTFVECACGTNNECCLSKVKKASAHIYRATRKGNNTSGLKILQQKEPKYVSIQERLLTQNITDLKQIDEHVATVPILTAGSDDKLAEAEVTIRPYIYNYITKKRKINSTDDSKMDYLPIPINLLPEPTAIATAGGVTNTAAKPVKKLSFADYKKKKKPA